MIAFNELPDSQLKIDPDHLRRLLPLATRFGELTWGTWKLSPVARTGAGIYLVMTPEVEEWKWIASAESVTLHWIWSLQDVVSLLTKARTEQAAAGASKALETREEKGEPMEYGGMDENGRMQT